MFEFSSLLPLIGNTSPFPIQTPTASQNHDTSLNSFFFQLLMGMMFNNSFSNEISKDNSWNYVFLPAMLKLYEKVVADSISNPTPNGYPLKGVITQTFHSSHHGIDFGVPVGTPISSTMDGEVLFAGMSNDGYGNLVIIGNQEYKTYYAHLSSIPVFPGEFIKAGTIIGYSGNTGNSTGPHLHYEVRLNNKAVNPELFTK